MLSQKLVLSAAGAGADPVYVDDVFSTFLYTGSGSARTITNGIDLSGEGGMVWLKRRNGTHGYRMVDTVRGATKALESYDTTAEATESNGLTGFTSTGFSVGTQDHYNGSAYKMVSWAFRKCPGFFDVVTYTGDNQMGRTVNHNLGSVPGCIMVKSTGSTTNWGVYHRGVPGAATQKLYLNTNAAKGTDNWWNDTAPTATSFQLSTDPSVNQSGTYVAYLFAHNEQTFGENEDEGIIKCDSYSGTGSTGLKVNVGFEPQWLLIKRTDSTGAWYCFDNMRGTYTDDTDSTLQVDEYGAESSYNFDAVAFNPTGFELETVSGGLNGSGGHYIYIAIRRSHKPPTAGTEVFAATTADNSGYFATNFDVDLAISEARIAGADNYWGTRLTGNNKYVESNKADAETTSSGQWDFEKSRTFKQGLLPSNYNPITWVFARKRKFMDVVTYTGNGINPSSVDHGLGAVPEMIIVKRRSANDWWTVYHSSQGVGKEAAINLNSAFSSNGRWGGINPVATAFYVQNDGQVNQNGQTYIAYLFASLPGVSKVGSYTGTGSTINVDCGFTNGARFVMIKRADAAADWFVVDTVRGISSGNDPYIRLNTNDAEGTTANIIDPLSSGFQVATGGGAAINTSGGTYIFLAIA